MDTSSYSKPVMPLKAVIFDWDYTLAQRPDGWRSFFGVGEAPAIKALRGSKSAAVGWLGGQVTRSDPLSIDVPAGGVSYKLEQWLRNSVPAHVEPGAISCIQRLLDSGVPVAIFSAGHDALVKQEVEALLPKNIVEQISVIGRSSGQPTKPNPAALQEVLQVLGVEAGPDVVMVGDRFQSDVTCALAGGVTPVLYGGGIRDVLALTHHNYESGKTIQHLPGVQSMQAYFSLLLAERDLGESIVTRA